MTSLGAAARRGALLFGPAVLLGCATAGSRADRAAAVAGDARRADRAFSASSAARDPAAFAALVAEDAVFLGAGGLREGRTAVSAAWAPLLARGGPRLTWEPVEAVAAGSGDLAVTLGRFRLEPAKGPAEEGGYVTVWRRDPDGELRALLDGSADPLPPLPASVARRAVRAVRSADGALEAEAGRLLDGSAEVGHYLAVRLRAPGGWRSVADAGRYAPAR
jgi:ketosteroid isomerase-like protein